MGGGVSEILYALVPLMRDVGLEADWHDHHRAARSSSTSRSCSTTPSRATRTRSATRTGRSSTATTSSTRSELERRLRLLHHPRPAAGRAAPVPAGHAAAAGSGAATSTSRRRTSTSLQQIVPMIEPYDCKVFHMQQYVPDGRRRQGRDRAAGDRPAVAQEHGAVARGRRLRLRPVRHRRRPAADLPGLALRPVEGPDRRDRRLPRGEASRSTASSSRWSARWRPTTPRAGTSSR